MSKRRAAAPSSGKGAPPAPELGVSVSDLEAVTQRMADLEARVLELERWVSSVLDKLNTSSQAAELAVSSSKLLEQRIDVLTLAVDEGIRHVDRAEKRIRATVGRARRELQELGVESPGLEAEAADLRVLDGGQGAGERVQAMHPTVDADPAAVAEDPLLASLRALKLSR